MNQIFIFIFLYISIFIYSYKTDKFGSSLLYLYTGSNLLISAILIKDELLKEFLSSEIICNLLVLLGILLIKKRNIIRNNNELVINNDILKKVFLIFGIFIFYHYYMIGIPYFSENIHTL